jgi:regulator of sigma E protease
METVQSFLIAVVSFLAVLSVVVIVHELGHYKVARWFKVKVNSFSLGMGPEIAGFTRRKTGVRWRIGAFPVGGYVMFEGDADEASTPDPSKATGNRASGLIQDQPVHVRAAVSAAGPFANFLFAIVVFAGLFLVFDEAYVRPLVDQVTPGGAAERAGIRPGDEIWSLDGIRTRGQNDVRRIALTSGGQTIDVVVVRNGQKIELEATPDVVSRETPFGDSEKQGALNIVLGGDPRTDVVRVEYNPLTALARGAEKSWEIIDTQLRFIGALVRGGMSAGHLSGPLGIGQTAGYVAESSAESAGPRASAADTAVSVAYGLIQLAAVLSIAIGFINLMPVPLLDGGHLVMQAIEAVRGRPLPLALQAMAARVGLFAIGGLFLFVTFQDIDRLGLHRLLPGGAG